MAKKKGNHVSGMSKGFKDHQRIVASTDNGTTYGRTGVTLLHAEIKESGVRRVLPDDLAASDDVD